MDNTRRLRYLTFGLLYFAQGAILSYFTALNALYLLSFDLSLTQIGLFGAIALTPFVLKIAAGMVSDRVSLFGRGHRLPYIWLGLLVQAVCLLIIPFIHPGLHFELLTFVAFVLMSGMALYDTATDGLALDTTPQEDLGTVQGIMVGGRALGLVVISAALGLLAHLTTWTVAFWALAAITLVPLPLVLRLREPARPAERRFEWRAFGAFRRGPVIALGALGIFYSILTYGANEIVNPFLEAEYNIDYLQAGLYTATWGLGMVAGGITGGRLADRFGRRQALLAAFFAATLTVLSLAFLPGPTAAWPLLFVFGLAFGYYDTVYMAIAMGYCDPRIAASMFALLMALTNVGTGVGFAVSGALADAIGYRWTFALLGPLNLLSVIFLPFIFRRAAPAPAIETQSQ